MTLYDKRYALYCKSVERTLADALPLTDCPQRSVEDAMRYSLLGGGKRIRAVLLLACCELGGGSTADALPLAGAIEMVHAYSLIHDDLPCMDNDTLRRGKPTCHIQFGEATALLAGDALLTMAFELIATAPLTADKRVAATRILAQAAGTRGMIGGQVIDIEHEGQPMEQGLLDRLHSLKTGALVRAAAALGCCAAGCTADTTATVDTFAARLGLIFQITDDLLDVTSTVEELGKPIGSDAVNHKTTYATLHGIDASRGILQQLAQEAKTAIAQLTQDKFLYELVDWMTNRTK